MFHGLFPFIDLDTGGTVKGYIEAQQKILSMADENTIIIPGHGVIATKADLQRTLMMITDSQARVRMLVDQDRTIEEVLESNPLSVYHDEYNWNFITTERMTRTIYSSLTEGE
jgi:glyoxylase-like metal-dependent hydrolase (beta-lactamase superfamily II)